MASFQNLCDRTGEDFDSYWAEGSSAELYHFIGKDIVIFPHAVLARDAAAVPASAAPTAVFCHGFLTVNGQKMSKSRGTFIMARTYLEHLDAEYLRYYIAAKLGAGLEDIDLNLEDFVLRVNSDLVGKVVNIASRCAGFITKRFDGQLAAGNEAAELLADFLAERDTIAAYYEGREYGKAIRQIMALADRANQYIDDEKPWALAKDPAQAARVQAVCSRGHRAVPRADDLPHAGAAGDGREGRRLPQERTRLGRACAPPRRAHHRHLQPADEPRRSRAHRRDGRGQQGRRGAGERAGGGRELPRRRRHSIRRSPKPSASRTSRRSTCAWRASSRPNRSRAPTSCWR